MLKGIDFSFGSGVTVAQIKAAGYQFVCRYLSGGNSKDISAAELANFKAGVLPVVFVWETTGTDMTSTANGVADARAAQAQLNSLSIAIKDTSLTRAPVYFAADESQEPAMLPYMEGANSVLGKARTGIYGGYGTVSQAFNAGVVTYGWQTTAWSGGSWDSRALLRQLGSVTVGPASCDIDEAAFWAASKILGLSDDFGQWPSPVPTPPPAPPAAPTSLSATPHKVVNANWDDMHVTSYNFQVADSSGNPIASGNVTVPRVNGVVLTGVGPWAMSVQSVSTTGAVSAWAVVPPITI